MRSLRSSSANAATRTGRAWRALVACALLATGLSISASPASGVGETLTVAIGQTDGTPAFDAVDDSVAVVPGRDSGPTNGIVRTNDSITYKISLANNGGTAESPTITFALPRGTELVQLPIFCLNPGSSVSPATIGAPVLPVTGTSWTALPIQTVTCRVADRAEASSFDYDFVAKVRPEVPNNTLLSPMTASAASTAAPTPVTTAPVQVRVSASPRFDLQKNGAGAGDTNSGTVFQSIKSCTSPAHAAFTACQAVMFPVLVSALGTNGKGATALTSPLTFTDNLDPNVFWGAGTTGKAGWNAAYAPTVRACGPTSSLETFSSVHPFGNGANNVGVRNSGTWSCTQTGTTATATITGADTTAYTTPSRNGTNNVAMPTDRGFVISGYLELEFPIAAINAIGNESSPGSGQFALPFFNTYTGFSPVDIAGNANEPEPLGNNDRSGNSTVATGSGFSKVFAGEPGNTANSGGVGYAAGNYSGPPGSTGGGNGTGTVLPGQKIISLLSSVISSPPGFTTSTHLVCDGWDNTKLALAADFYQGRTAGTVVDPDTGAVSPPASGATAGFFQFLPSNGAAVWPSLVATPAPTIQYAAGGGSAASANSCLAETTGWYSSPDQVPGNDPALAAEGVYTAVGRVRYAVTVPSTVTQNTTLNYVMSIGLQTLDVPNDTIVPNWAAEKEQYSANGLTLDQMVTDPGYITRRSNYNPANASGALGDRATVATAVARLNKEVFNPAATPPGYTSAAVPQYASGVNVDYRLSPTVTAGIITDLTADTKVEDCLAPFQSFVTSSIQGQAGTRLPDVISAGAPAGAGIACPANRTYLRWELGEVTIGSIIPPILYTVNVSSTAPNGVLTNSAMVTTAGDISAVAARTDTAQIQIVAPAGIKLAKTALKPLVEVNPVGVTNPRTLDWTVSFANVDTANVSNVDIVDRLPSQGLNGTDFTGTLAFTSASPIAGTNIELLYTSAPPATINSDPSAASNLAGGGTTWCSAAVDGFVVSGSGTAADCPTGNASVTGLRIRRAGAFATTDVLSVRVRMTPAGNAADDVYVNRVGARAQGVNLGVGPLDRPIGVVSSSVGDFVWLDFDQDGVQDAGEPGVPDFPVSLTGTDVDGNAVSLDTTTDADGAYAFDGLASGDYTVTFDPAGLTGSQAFTGKGQGGDVALDSDGDPTTGVTDTFALGVDAVDPDIDQGIVLPTGSISLTKAIVDPAPFDDLGDAATFPVTVACTGPAGYPDVSRDVTIARNGTPTVVDGLWVGSVCTITETGTDGGTVTYSPATPVTVVDGQPQSVTITNTFPEFPTGSISLSKAIVDPAPFDDLGDAATFPVTVACTGPGTAPDVSRDVTIARDGTPTVVDGLFAGSVCTITETGLDGGTVTYAPATPVTVVDGQSVSVTITNTFPEFPTGSISLSKAIVVPAPFDDLGDATTFAVTVDCTGPGTAPGQSEDVTVNRDGTPTVVSGLFVGSSCTVTETGLDGGSVAYAPATPVVVPADGGTAVSVTITNTFPEFPTGSISLSKVIVDPAPWDDTGDDPTFPVTVACTGPGDAPDVTREVTIARDGTPTIVDGLYAGSTCTITETGTDAGTVTYSPATPVVVVAGQSVSVSVINTFPEAPVGSLVLSKAIVDPFPGDELGDAGSFPVTVACTGPTGASDETTIVLLDRDGTPVNVEALVGSTCTVTETDTDGGTVAYTPGSSIEITGTAAVTVTVTNTFPSETTTTSATSTTAPGSTTTPSSVVPTSINSNPVTPSTSPGTGTSNSGTGALPRTGASILGLVLIGAVSLGLGALVLRTRRHLQSN